MAIQSQPSRIPQPFAGSGTKNTIPATNTTPSASQAASWASGFPPECSQPISAGGCPVPRNDMNGTLNWLSQDYSFRQDGGVWAWSALADYDTQRMVRGSDGLLYWSVAQSGPNTVAGAKDPTSDGGTYWRAPYAKTMPLADKSAACATTNWVKSIAAAPVYVDAAGSDSNDGLSSSTPVATFAKAAQICKNLGQSSSNLKVSGGTYTENVSLSGFRCKVELLGDVTLSGLTISEAAHVLIYCNSHDFTVNSRVYVTNKSIAYFITPSTFTVSSSGSAAFVVYSSSVFIDADCDFNATNASYVMSVLHSYIEFYNGKTLSLTGTSISNAALYVDSSRCAFNTVISVKGSTYSGVSVVNGSAVDFYGKVTVGSGVVTNGNGISVNLNSMCVFHAGCTSFSCTSSGGDSLAGLSVTHGSTVNLIGGASIVYSFVANHASACAIFVAGTSCLIVGGELLITARGGGGTQGYCAISVSECSYVLFGGTYSHLFWDNWSFAVFGCFGCAAIYIGSGVDLTGGGPSGKNFSVRRGGQINTGGRIAPQDMPGNGTYTIDSASYGYFN